MDDKKQRKKKQSEKVGIEAVVEPRVGALYVKSWIACIRKKRGKLRAQK